MNTSLERWLFALLLVTLLGIGGTSIYQAQVIEQQQHAIRQYMGLEQGVDETPQPPKALVPPVGPEAPKSFVDQRRWQRAL